MTPKNKTKRAKECTDKPYVPNKPKVPYRFSEFVHLVQKDFYYGRAIHEIVKYGRQCDEKWAVEQLRHHVEFPPRELSDLATTDGDLGDRCSNNTKFFMLDFCRYI
jgi:hypothetical protein